MDQLSVVPSHGRMRQPRHPGPAESVDLSHRTRRIDPRQPCARRVCGGFPARGVVSTRPARHWRPG